MIELTQEQETVIQQAVHWFYNESSQVFEIAGLAGTGKSVILMEIVRRLQLQPYQYIAAAYTGAAAVVMRMKGFPTARSLHA
jgi:adenylylsulfate kinase-like enzyme